LYKFPFFPFFPDSIPEELKPGRVWVCCDENKAPMVPLMRGRSRYASSTNPATWRTFEEACQAYDAGRFAGVGRVIAKDGGYVGVDIDHCRNPETGRINDRGRALLKRLDSYSEVSPSGTGVKVWCRGTLPMSHVKDGLEVYVRGRYFTLTGRFLAQYSAEIEERTEALAAIVAEEFPRARPPRSRHASAYGGPRFDLDRILETGNVDVLAEDMSDIQAERKYRIVCPWIEEHTKAPETGTYVGQYDSGALFFWCWHSHCRHRRWRDFCRTVRRPKRIGDFVEVNISYEQR
jgi:putative DNA primase/helicase